MTPDPVDSYSARFKVLRLLYTTSMMKTSILMNCQMPPVETRIKEPETMVSLKKRLHLGSTWRERVAMTQDPPRPSPLSLHSLNASDILTEPLERATFNFLLKLLRHFQPLSFERICCRFPTWHSSSAKVPGELAFSGRIQASSHFRGSLPVLGSMLNFPCSFPLIIE